MKRRGPVKHSLFGTRAKNFRGSHLGELEWVLLLFWFGFIRKNRNWEKESKLTSVAHLWQGSRWPQVTLVSLKD